MSHFILKAKMKNSKKPKVKVVDGCKVYDFMSYKFPGYDSAKKEMLEEFRNILGK